MTSHKKTSYQTSMCSRSGRVVFVLLLTLVGGASFVGWRFGTRLSAHFEPSPEVARRTQAALAPTQRLIASDPTPQGLAPSDWSSIRAAYEQGRHRAFPVAGGHQARNPGQQWRTHFDGRGFAVQPDAGAWRWGLELRGYGFDRQTRDLPGQARVTTDGARVTYTWDETLEEWFVNDQRGLEHGFTLKQPPASGAGAGERLELRLGVRGGLRPQVQAGGRGVSFVNAAGGTMVNYAGLKVWDADGRELGAQFEAEAEGLRLMVEERGARYPLTIDPIAQQAYLKASNTGADDFFGFSVAVSGDTVVVGAFAEDSNATGVNGNQSDNSAISSGAVYVFVRSGGGWSQQAYLKASNTEATNDVFGYSVAISGDTLVVGALQEDSNATGVNGNQSNNSASDSGAAYVFVRSGGSWSQQAYLKASNTGAGDWFGQLVAISGDTVVVGAVFEDSNATGVNGNQSDNSASQSGAAYVFVRSGGSWSQQAYLKASNTETNDYFGVLVAISGDTVIVGAYQEASNATGVNGTQSDNSAPISGAAYVFVRSGGSWSQQAYLKASNTGAGDFFGQSVAISGDTVVVGAFGEDSNATGVNGNQSDNSAISSGAVYVFVRSGGSWSQQAYLKASNTEANDVFGYSVAVSGDTVVVGAFWEDSNATGVNGNQSDNSASDSGAAYVFVRSGGSWSQQAYLKASNTGAGDWFGQLVAISGDTVVVGARNEASNATGVNGNQSNNSATNSGAAYVFHINQAPVAQCQNVTVSAGASCTANASIDAGSSDAEDGTAVTLSQSPPGPYPLGNTTVTLTVTDSQGAFSSCQAVVTVVDQTAPTITLTGAQIALWPPNHKYETINLAQLVASASDNCNGNLTGNVVIAQVSSDEPEDAPGGGDGNTLNDIVIAANCKSVQLRAERQGSGNGRVYTITFKVKDAAGNTTTATAKVTVPKSQGNNGAAIDDGPAYTKLGSCP